MGKPISFSLDPRVNPIRLKHQWVPFVLRSKVDEQLDKLSIAYPMPVVQHLLHSLGNGRVFAKLDLAQAYQQLPVDAATVEADYCDPQGGIQMQLITIWG